MYAIELLKILGAYELSTNSLDKYPTKTKTLGFFNKNEGN